MDVRCQKCGIEYEFDDAKVTLAGVTVKCTNCGHVFKVKREEPAPAAAGAMMHDLPRTATATTLPPVTPKADGAEWMVRQPSGTVFRFKELTTLQKWIVERKVNREDEISKTGKSWKRLGDIAELASFFQVVDAANAALQASIVPMGQSPAAQAQVNAPLPPMTPAPPPQVSAQTVQPGFVVVHQHATGQTQVGMQALQMPSRDPQPASPAAPQVPLAPAQPSLPPRAAADPLDALDDDDPVAQWGKARRRRNVALLFVLALAVAVGVLMVVQPPFVVALLGQDGSADLDVDGVYQAVRADDPAALTRALTGVRAAGPSARASALEARMLCAEASHAREEERLHGVLRALAPAGATQQDAEADKANARAGELLGRAYPLVSDVRAKAPKLADAHLAAATYNLEKGGLAELKTDLESARAAAQPEEKGRLDAELAVLQALADVRAVIEKPDAAVLRATAEKVPASSDARLQYARAALTVTALARAPQPTAEPDRTAARALVDALSVKDARHALLVRILDALAPQASADAGVVVADAGVAASADAGVAASVDAGAAPADNAPETYEALMQKAERASLNERPAQARELFTRAIKLKPGSVRAHIGLGWASLDLGKNGEAQRAFKKAISIDDGNSDAHFGLAEALRFAGDKAGALAQYQLYLQMDPTGKEAAVAKRAIEALQ